MTVRTCGRYARENAGISSESQVRILTVESLRIPGEGSSTQGKSGPKPRAESRRRWTIGGNSDTADVCMTEAMTQEAKRTVQMELCGQAARLNGSEERHLLRLSCDGEAKTVAKSR